MSKRVTEKCDIELENIVGNLVIAEYQRDKLQSKLSEGVGPFRSMDKKRSSSYVFKKDDKWYRISLSAETMAT